MPLNFALIRKERRVRRGRYQCFDGLSEDDPTIITARAQHEKAMGLLGDTLRGVPPPDPFETAWETVAATLGAAAGTVDIDVSKLKSAGTVVGVRYGQRNQQLLSPAALTCQVA